MRVEDRVQEFSLAAPLPQGRVVLAASAGTGKTYTIAGLAVRYVAEGVCELQELLIVTFTRAAAAELRDRVRSRLVAAQAHLDAVLAGGPPGSDDDALAAVAAADPTELRHRRRRLVAALADFDAATIATIHGFCQQVLSGLGLVADTDPDAEMAEDTSELLEQVVDDVLVARFAAGEVPPLTRRQLITIAATVVGNPDAALVPDPTEVDGSARTRAELIAAVQERFAATKHHQRVLSYDDLLTRLRDALVDADRGDAAVAALRARYRVALVDEFQDTDPVQWEILRRAFSGPDSTLVLIGDPKQAIYAFRGADVHAYLDAVESALHRATLATSWRSDAGLLAAFDALFEGVTYGHPGIVHRPVAAAAGHEHPRLLVDGGLPPLRVRCLRRDQGLRGSLGDIPAPVAQNQIVADVTREAVHLLDAGAVVIDRNRAGEKGPSRPLTCRDIAVLVRTNAQANHVQRSLLDAGVPAIINGVGSVLTTAAAGEWRRLLEALEQPTSVGRVRAAALTSFLGWSAPRLAEADDDDLVPIHDLLHTWAELLREHGVASLLRTITVTQALPQRVLGRPDGERFLTDLQHVGQLLHTAASDEQHGPATLAAWLRVRAAEAAAENIPPDEQARRLESDDQAVQILTIHRSKGLEFPVVLCPFMSSPGRTWTTVPVFHGPDGGPRTVDVGGPQWDGFKPHKELAEEEIKGELLRLLYVALTRARHHVVVWWAPVKDSGVSSLGRVLFGRRHDDGVDTSGTAPITSDDRLRGRLDELATRSGGRIVIEDTPDRLDAAPWQPEAEPTVALTAANIDRDVDTSWQRTSYSRLTSHAYDPGPVTSEPDGPVTDDEELAPAGPLPGPGYASPTLTEGALRGLDLPLAEAGAGTAFGTFVHAVLEQADFAAVDIDGELAAAIAQVHDRHPVEVDPDVLVHGLRAALETPLGPLAAGRRLRDVMPQDRLDELVFELPLAGGDAGGRHGSTHGPVTVRAVGELLRSHLPATDPLAAYADHLDDPGFATEVRGYLTGSIDIVVRTRAASGVPRYLVVDHKTNRLGVPGSALSAWDYRPDALADAMIHGHYPLQALLYQVALHRYLRWRQRDYDPAQHLGGVLYLFLRGMIGPAGVLGPGGSCGVFAWMPPAQLVLDLSDLLDGRP